MQTKGIRKKPTAMSWVAVLVLGLVIFGLTRGVVWLWGGKHTYNVVYRWLDKWNGFSGYPGLEGWQGVLPAAITTVVLLLVVLLASIIARKLSRDPQRVERRALALGSGALYLPAFVGGLPAVLGLISIMVTPFLGGGLISIVALLLQRIGLSHDVGDWIARGMVGSSWDWYEESVTRFMIAQAIVAAGLAITIMGFIQVFRAYREKRLQRQGLYATVRHPQHLGIALWTFGLAFAVSGTAGYMMWFTVLYLYVLLALWEERQLVQQFGTAYESYRGVTPFMIPFINIGFPLPRSGIPRIVALIAYYVAGMAILCLILQGIGVERPGFP
jgi:protein-S-isoprenylcysteine O-methyltransferase Ste14